MKNIGVIINTKRSRARAAVEELKELAARHGFSLFAEKADIAEMLEAEHMPASGFGSRMDAVLAMGLVQREDDLTVRSGLEGIRLGESLRQLAVVVDLPIHGENHLPITAEERLLSSIDIDDGEAAMAQRHAIP